MGDKSIPKGLKKIFMIGINHALPQLGFDFGK